MTKKKSWKETRQQNNNEHFKNFFHIFFIVIVDFDTKNIFNLKNLCS